ncbi:MAG: peptidylprolyl isomerase [Planctomycetota bacterium]
MRIGLMLAGSAVLLSLTGCNWFRSLRGGDAEREGLRDVITAGEPGGAAGASADVTAGVGTVDDAGLVPKRFPEPDQAEPAPPVGEPIAGDAGTAQGINVPDLSQAPDADDPEPTGGFATDRVIPVGGVIARVNGTAIYTDEILRDVRPILRARAQTMAKERYAVVAEREIRQQLERLIADQVRLTQAEQSLTAQEMRIAEMRAFEWRRAQVTEAGGSFTEANRRAKALGFEDLEEMVARKYDAFLIEVYMQLKLFPRITVSPEEMRLRYKQIVDEAFTSKSQAQWRLLRINENAAGGEEAARTKAEQLKARIDAGELDFLAAAEQFNDDPMLRQNGGDLGLGLMERGSYRHTHIEDAVYAGDIGDTVGPLPMTDSLGKAFVLAYVEQKSEGRVRGFEEPAVQAELESQLRQEKFMQLQAEEARGEQAQALVERLGDGVQTALDIALLDYDRWNATK